MLFLEKRKSLSFLNSNWNSNFAGTHVILEKKGKFKFSQFQIEFEFCWHPCYFRKNGKFLIFSIRIRIRIPILLEPKSLYEKMNSLNILNSNSNSNFGATHVNIGKKEKYKFSEFEFEFCWQA